MSESITPSSNQKLIDRLRAHGRDVNDDLKELLADNRLKFSEREAIEGLQQACMDAVAALQRFGSSDETKEIYQRENERLRAVPKRIDPSRLRIACTLI